jgi:hypothetical protein
MREKKPPYKPDPETLRKNAHLKDFFPFIHDLGFESDRGAVLLCCANLAYRAPDMEGEPPFPPSTRFTTAALIATLTNRPAYVRRERCKPKQWPR